MTPTKEWSPAKPGRFGAAVIGEELAEEQAEIRQRQKNVFGPKVFGDRVDDRDESEVLGEKIASSLDPEPGNEDVTAAIEKAAGDDGYLSVKNLQKAIKDGPPATFDRLLEAELQRTPPRKSALRHFLATETQRDGGPRKDVLRVIETTLARANAA